MPKTYPVPCTREEMSALIDSAIDDEFYYTLFVVAKTTGRRLGEYYDIKVKDIDFDKGIMMTKVLKRGQRIMREAILTPETGRLLKQYIRRNALKLDDYVFRKFSYRRIQEVVKKFAKKAGIEHNVSFHNFRHYFVTELFKLGWTYDKISKLTGHSSPGTLVAYDSSVASDIKADALESISKI